MWYNDVLLVLFFWNVLGTQHANSYVKSRNIYISTAVFNEQLAFSQPKFSLNSLKQLFDRSELAIFNRNIIF